MDLIRAAAALALALVVPAALGAVPAHAAATGCAADPSLEHRVLV